jgi:RIO-like serine/threonine protein kinase
MNSTPTEKEMRSPEWIPDQPLKTRAKMGQQSAYRRLRMALGKLRRGRNPFAD